jgi:4-hydroxybenzoate polyprenyltransferase/geranylgeranylglycerol-phosphate geranylgeranyltransferase
VVGAICDRDGDRAGGYRTVPVRYGDRVALWLLVAFDAGWVALAALYPTTAVHGFHTVPYLPFLAVALVMGTVTVVKLFRAPRPIPRLAALRAHEILVVERLVLAAGLVAAAASVVLALALLIPAAGATVAASVGLMRSRYEPTRARARRKAA